MFRKLKIMMIMVAVSFTLVFVGGCESEAQTASALVLKGRMPLLPKRIDRIENLREVVRRIIPIGGAS